MGVAAHAQSGVYKASVAWERGIFGNNTLLEKCKCLRGLESRAGRVCAHDCSVEQGLAFVVGEFFVIGSTLSADKNVWVVRW